MWAEWRRLWKEDEITSVDALQASSWAKSAMGTYYTHFCNLALWAGYPPVAELEVAACQYLYELWGLGYSRSYLRVAVSALRALEDMGWLPAFVSSWIWRCAKWVWTVAVVQPYAGLGELRTFALACTCMAQWPAFSGWVRWHHSGAGAPEAGVGDFTPLSVTHASHGDEWERTAGLGSASLMPRGPHPRCPGISSRGCD